MRNEAGLDLQQALLTALNELPSTSAIPRVEQPADAQVDMMVDMTIGEQRRLLLVECKQTVFPRDVREILYRLLPQRNASTDREQLLPMILADTLSPGARQEIREAGVGYFDLSGSLYLPAGPALIYIEKPPRKAQAKQLGSVFHGRKAAVLRILFERRDAWVTVKEVAESAQVSPATASETLTELERRDWIVTRGAGPAKQRRLSKPTEMLDAWTREVATRPPAKWRRYYVSDVEATLTRRLADVARDVGARYAITGEAAGQAYAPWLTGISQLRCRMPLDSTGAQVLDLLRAKPVHEGWNLAVHDSRSLSDLSDARWIDGVCFASPLQVYLDLQQGPGRSRDLAEHLRETVLRA